MFIWKKRKILEEINNQYGKIKTDFQKTQMENRLQQIRLYYKENYEQQEKIASVDDVTWNDLNMDAIFAEINHTHSYIGEQVLYNNLHELRKQEEIEEYEKEIKFFEEHERERLETQYKLSSFGKMKNDYYLPPMLSLTNMWKINGNIMIHLFQILLLACIIIALITDSEVAVAGIVICCFINIITYINAKSKYEVYLHSLGSIKKIILLSDELINKDLSNKIKVPDTLVKNVRELKPLSKKIVAIINRNAASLTGDMQSLVAEYLWGITLIDIATFNYIVNAINGKEQQILELYKFLGELDVAISIGSYRKSLKNWCKPKFNTVEGIEAVGLYHPLLADGVPNDISLDKNALITGANASGKSTFMKTLAVNAVLAQTIYTCTGESFAMEEMNVTTSMALRDNIITGESYYISEAKRIKFMIDLDDHKPSLIVIDEILKGTNTSERIAASIGILDYFSKTNNLMLVATHDMELVEELGHKYENYYFESTVTDSDIIFEYKIHKGLGGESNAIALLSLLDYPDEILQIARRV